MNILVVDDERIQIESLRRGLRRKGYQVIGALNASEALDRLHNGTPVDMVLTDYAMPGMNGLELLKKIREKHHTLPVVLMTAYGDKRLIVEALQNHCDGFIEKPFTLDQLVQETEKVAKRFGGRVTPRIGAAEVSELIAKYIHKINNPLMTIIGSAELAMVQIDDLDTVKQHLLRIVEAAEKINEINEEVKKAGKAEKK